MDHLGEIQQHMDNAIQHLKDELAKLQTGRASTNLVEHIKVDSYGSIQPLKAVANISVPESQAISIQPWDRSMIAAIEKAIMTSDLGLNPSNDGAVIRLAIPSLTEERRKDLCKIARKIAEEAKVAVRTARQSMLKHIDNDDAMSEDQQKAMEKKVQERVDATNKTIDDLSSQKEKDILTI